jgi:hypothetical protein
MREMHEMHPAWGTADKTKLVKVQNRKRGGRFQAKMAGNSRQIRGLVFGQCPFFNLIDWDGCRSS